MRKLLLIFSLVLAGCASKGDEAAEAYEIAKNSGASDAQLCRSAQAVWDAYVASGDATEAEQWKTQASIDCSLAHFKEGYRELRPSE